MTDLIRRSVLIDEICRSSIYKWSVEEDQAAHNWALNIINSQPSVESSKGDLISRADAIDAVCRTRCGDKAKGCPAHSCLVIEEFDAIPSADAVEVDRTSEWVAVRREEYEDLIADAVHGEWKFVDHEVFAGEYFCSICGKRAEVDLYGEWILSNYCPSCGARMENKE